MHVLLVDDDKVDIAHTARLLKRSELSPHIISTSSPTEALGYVQSQCFDVILIDYLMPGKDGIEMIMDIKSVELNSSAAIILMSNVEDEDVTRQCIQVGAHDFVPKNEITAARLKRAIVQAQTRSQLEKQVEDSNKKIRVLAQQDSLTGLTNRHFFEEQLRNSLELAARRVRPLGLMVIDLDNFKYVNDSFGHDAGDILLKQVTVRIKSQLRGTEVFARLGGDEFAVLIPDMDGIGVPSLIAERVIKEVGEPYLLDGVTVTTGASIGISIFPRDGTTAEEMLKNADIAMYRAKKQGKNGYSYFEQEMHSQVMERVLIEKEILNGLDNGEFELFFQPIINLRKNTVQTVEALIRWNKPTGMMFPDKFIPIAEESGIILKLGKWIIFEAYRSLAKLRKDAPELRVAINMSTVQLMDKSLITYFTEAATEAGLPVNAVDVELTETSFLNSSDDNVKLVSQMQAIGIQLSLDDFGTGYSSISHLHNFPISIVKIDRSIMPDVSPVETDQHTERSKTQLLFEGLSSMISTLGLDVVAEGLETEDQLDLAMSLDIATVQGYFFSKPLNFEDIQQFIAGWESNGAKIVASARKHPAKLVHLRKEA